jgi:hypothetical protein
MRVGSRNGKEAKLVPTQEHPSIGRGQPTISERAEDDEALAMAPRGAFVVAALGLAIMLAGWVAFYFLLFLPRGVIG